MYNFDYASYVCPHGYIKYAEPNNWFKPAFHFTRLPNSALIKSLMIDWAQNTNSLTDLISVINTAVVDLWPVPLSLEIRFLACCYCTHVCCMQLGCIYYVYINCFVSVSLAVCQAMLFSCQTNPLLVFFPNLKWPILCQIN